MADAADAAAAALPYRRLDRDDPACPAGLREAAARCDVRALDALGDVALAARPLLGFVCSARCPGGVILGAYDLGRWWRAQGVAVVSGFHSPIERELLRLLLVGQQPIVLCAARSLARLRPPAEWRAALAAGRLLVVSPITGEARRASAAQAMARNQFVAALAAATGGALLAAHAAPGGKTEALCDAVLARGEPLLVCDDASNAELVARGAQAISAATFGAWWGGCAG